MSHYEYLTLVLDVNKPFNVSLHKLLIPIKCKTIENTYELKFKALNYTILTNNVAIPIILEQWDEMKIDYIIDKLLMKMWYRGLKTFHTIPISLN